MMRKLGSLPIGIWVAWLGILKLLIVEILKLGRFWGVFCSGGAAGPADLFVVWPVLILAIVTLWLRRFSARIFVSMAMALYLYDSVAVFDIVGIVLAPLGVVGVMACRRWFDEYFMKEGW